MDALKAQFERIRQQLAALTATQKMLVVALIAVMVLTMLYWGRYAGNAEMVSLLGDQTLAEDDIGPIVQQLKLQDIPYRVDTGNKVMVPTERQNEILATLMFARALPSDTHSAFETMSKTLNPFTGNTEREAAYTQATATELSSLIGRFPGVTYAHVVINSKNEIRIEDSIPPSASVFVSTRSDPEHIKQLVRACADGVAHAVSGLTPGQISVIVNGAPMKVPDTDNDVATDAQDLRKAREAELEQKIRGEFRYIEGLTVSVNCDVDMRDVREETQTFDKNKTLNLQETDKTTKEDTQTSSPVSHEPGASPNTGIAGTNGSISLDGSSAGGAAPQNTISKETEDSTNHIFPASTNTHVHTPAGKDSVQSATVRVPMSYFASAYKLKTHKSGDPAEADLAAFSSAEMTSIRDGVKNIIGLKSDADLSVDSYADVPVDLAMATGPSTPAATLTTVSGHAREIGVAVLAVVSLLMMAMMVRKSTPPPLVMPSVGQGTAAAAAARAEMNSLGSGESVAGEVGAGGSTLDGMEMDEDAVRTQQMLDQVSTMVKENPDGAAALVKRWLSRV
jgi:flagellar biosynthesis/type III secretory pathway M-ring protein FliF/YscJ